jgi:hypothetical protein
MIAVIDIEASGLVDGYPIEIGWAREDGHVGAVLLRPPQMWTDDLRWTVEAEQIHGLSREILDKHGVGPSAAYEKMNAELLSCRCFSDAPAFDWGWLALLIEIALGADKEPTFDLIPEDADSVIAGLVTLGLTRVVDRVRVIEMLDATQRGRPHSAPGDAGRWMAALELGRGGLVDDVSIKTVIEKWDARAKAATPWRK